MKGVYTVDENGGNADYNCGKLVSNAIDIAKKEYPNVPVIIINRVSVTLYGQNENENYYLAKPVKFVDKVFTEFNDEYRSNLTGHMINTICEFAQNNPVYLVRPTPELKQNVPNTMFRASTLNDKKYSVKIPVEEYNERQKVASEMQDEAIQRCGVKVLDPTPYFCDDEYCYGDIDGVPLYLDDDHVSSYGSEVISPIYDEVFQ